MEEKHEEKMIICFGYIDMWVSKHWDVELLPSSDIINFEYGLSYLFEFNVKKLPVESIGLFDLKERRMSFSRGNFLLHLCRSYLEAYKVE